MPRRLLALLSCLFVCSTHAQDILIAAENDWPPYSYLQPGSTQPQGMTPLLVREAFASQDIAVRFVSVTLGQCQQLTLAGKVAACFNVSVTDDNRKQFLWPRTPLFYEEVGIFGLLPAQSGIAGQLPALPVNVDQQTLQGRSLGITQGYTYPSKLIADPGIRKVVAATESQLIDMLLDRQVDYILMNTLPGLLHLQQHGAAGKRVQRLGVVGMDAFLLAFSRKHPQGAALARKFDAGMQTLHASGRYQQIMQSYRQQLGMH